MKLVPYNWDSYDVFWFIWMVVGLFCLVVGLFCMIVGLILGVTEVTSLPAVHRSRTTRECVKVDDRGRRYDGVRYDCANQPPEFTNVWVQ